MSETKLVTRRKVLAFTAVVEIGTGLVLIVAPVMVVALLLGSHLSSEGVPIGRVAGFALLALGVAVWQAGPSAEGGHQASRGMLIYNALVAVYLFHLATFRHVGGPLLWPAVALHALVALLLVWTWRSEERAQASRP